MSVAKETTLEAGEDLDRLAVFLKPEAKIEPLVCGWYAWIHLIAPLQHALNITYRHLPLMQSFEKNPGVHAAASADPQLFGGPFVDLPPDRRSDVQALIAQTQDRCSKLIALAQDIRMLDRSLQERAKGYALDEMFNKLPPTLCGLVEFLYDINNHPRLRFQEALAYDEYYDPGVQQICLSLIKDEQRPFFMTTPRVATSDSLIFSIPFSDQRLDRLASMRTKPEPLTTVAEEFGITSEQRPKFERLFTNQRPTIRNDKPRDHEVRVRYFGHACVLIESATTSILIDPMFCWENNRIDGRFTFHDLPERLDYVVLSHTHHDHCAPEVLIQLRHRIGRLIVPQNNLGSITDPAMHLLLAHIGFERVEVVEAFDEIAFDGGKIVSLPFMGEHCDLDVYSRQGIHVEICGRKFAFHIDSNGMDPGLFTRMAKRLGKKVDAIFIGMECHGAPLSWLYGPLLTNAINRKNDDSRRLSGLDSARALRLIREFDSENVFVYAIGQEPWLKFIMGLEYTPDSIQLKEIASLLEQCKQSSIHAERLFISREFLF